MDLKKIMELLKIDQLDESVQSELTKFLTNLVDVKVQEKVEELKTAAIDEAKTVKMTELSEQFEEFKKDFVSKFSIFVDGVLDEEMELPEKLVEFARKGELYDDLIEQFKVRLGIDEGKLDEEAKKLLAEAKDEIEEKDEKINALMSEALEHKTAAQKFATELYVQRKVSGLTESQKTKAIALLEGFKTKEDIDNKFEAIRDIIIGEGKKPTNEDAKTTCVCPECKHETMISEGSCSTTPCPECEAKSMKEKTEEKVEEKKEEKVEESVSPFAQHVQAFAQTLKNKNW